MKKTLCLTLLLVCHSAMAKKDIPAFNGFYVKGGLGASQPIFDNDRDFSYVDTVSGVSSGYGIPLQRDYVVTAFAGMLGFGYSYQMGSMWVLSAEFAAQFTQAESEFSAGLVTNDVTLQGESITKLKNDFSLLIKPGIVTQGKTQFYALLGPRWGNFESTVESSFVGSFPVVDVSSSSDASGYSLGFTIGLGVERAIDDGFSIALEYSYTTYGKIPSVSDNYNVLTTLTESIDVEYEDKTTASVNTLMVDLIYRF